MLVVSPSHLGFFCFASKVHERDVILEMDHESAFEKYLGSESLACSNYKDLALKICSPSRSISLKKKSDLATDNKQPQIVGFHVIRNCVDLYCSVCES